MPKNKKRLEKGKIQTDLTQRTVFLWGVAAFLAVLTFICYQPSLKNGFVNWDDATYVYDNPYLLNPSSANTHILLTEPTSLNFHPITMWTLIQNYKWSQLDAYSYHFVNLLFHILNTLLVFLFFYLLGGKKWIVGAVTAALFAFHPMHVESVAWVSERKDVLYVFFFLAGLVSYWFYLDKKDYKFLGLTFLFFVLSCLSKAMAVVFPVVLLLVDYYQGRILNAVKSKNEYKKALLEKIPFLWVSIGFGLAAVRIQSAGAINEFDTFTLWQRIMFASYGFISYIGKLFYPLPQSALYPYPTLDAEGNIPFIFHLSPFIVLLILGAVVYSMRKMKLLLFGVGFYLVSVALVLQFLSVGIAIIADRYTYLAYLGLFFVLAVLFSEVWENENKKIKNIRVPLAGLLLVGVGWLAFLTNERISVWKNGETLWTDVLKTYPGYPKPYIYRGNYRGKNQDFKGALSDFEMAVRLGTDDAEVFKSLGNAYGSLGRLEDALSAFNKGLLKAPDDYSMYLNRGITYCMKKDYAPALKDFETALSMDIAPGKKIPLYQNRGVALLTMGRLDESQSDFNAILKINPSYAFALAKLSEIYFRKGDKANARVYAQKAQQLGQKFNPQYLENLN